MNTKDIVFVALFAAITAALGLFPPITLPVVGVPVTAQSMGMMLAGAIVGAKRGSLAIALFVLLVCAGMPLMSGGRGGFGVILSPGGGFILAWPIGALIIGYLFEKNRDRLNFWNSAAFIVAGSLMTYIIGVPWISAVTGISLWAATVGSLPFLPGDLVKILLTVVIARSVRRAYPILGTSGSR